MGGEYIPRDDLTALECLPKVLLDLFGRGVFADGLLHLEHPTEDFLVCETGGSDGQVKDIVWIWLGREGGGMLTRGEDQRDQGVQRSTRGMGHSGPSRQGLL